VTQAIGIALTTPIYEFATHTRWMCAPQDDLPEPRLCRPTTQRAAEHRAPQVGSDTSRCFLAWNKTRARLPSSCDDGAREVDDGEATFVPASFAKSSNEARPTINSKRRRNRFAISLSGHGPSDAEVAR
jgi:hypothetical protein